MNSLQLAHRLARKLIVPDPTNLDGDAALDVLAAINSGLSTYYRELPGDYKRTTISATLKEPAEVSLTFTAKYSNAVAASTFTAEQRGCTLRVSGSPDTEITGTATVLDDHLQDDLTLDGTIYYDAVPIRDVIKLITGYVRLYPSGGSQQDFRILREGSRNRLFGWFTGEDGMRSWAPASALGEPTHYWLEALGASQGAEPEFLLRVYPKPERDYIIRFEAELGHRQLTFADLATAAVVPVSADWVDDILVPLCEADLCTSSLWRPSAGKPADVQAKAERVIAQRIGMIAPKIAPTRNRVGTPRGF